MSSNNTSAELHAAANALKAAAKAWDRGAYASTTARQLEDAEIHMERAKALLGIHIGD